MAEIKQYVNLDPDKPDQLKEVPAERAGRNIVVKAKINKKLAGVPVIFEMKCGDKNVDPGLDLSNFSFAEQMRMILGVAGVGAAKMVRRRAITDDQGEATVDLILSNYGGDEFEVEAYLKKKKADKLVSDKYVTWRRIYYQVSRFKNGAKGAGHTGTLAVIPHFSWADVKAEFEVRQHNIELVDDSSADLVTRQCNVLTPANNYFDYKKSAKRGYDSKREPVSMRVILLNQIANFATRTYIFRKKKEGDAALTKIFSSRLWMDESKAIKKDAIISLKWRRVGAPGWADMGLKYVTIDFPNKITINFEDMKIPKNHVFDFFRKVDVRIKVKFLSSSTNGCSWHNTIWIANENMHSGARGDEGKKATTIHEVGHFIGLVPDSQSTYYDEHGHQGGHCTQGLSASDIAQASYRGLSGTCVMFGESAASRVNVFCADCDPSVRTSEVKVDRMPADW